MDQVGRVLVVGGLAMAFIGAILWFGQGVPWLRLGRLPGDVSYEKEGFSLFIPITTMVILSILMTLVFWIVQSLRR